MRVAPNLDVPRNLSDVERLELALVQGGLMIEHEEWREWRRMNAEDRARARKTLRCLELGIPW